MNKLVKIVKVANKAYVVEFRLRYKGSPLTTSTEAFAFLYFVTMVQRTKSSVLLLNWSLQKVA